METSNGIGKAYASTNSDKLRSPSMQPAVWRRDNGSIADNNYSTDLKSKSSVTSMDRP
jgi:hypothetical protein